MNEDFDSEAEPDRDEMRDEYDFTPEQFRDARQGKYAGLYPQDTIAVVIDPEVLDVFPNGEGINSALRALAAIIRQQREAVSTDEVKAA